MKEVRGWAIGERVSSVLEEDSAPEEEIGSLKTEGRVYFVALARYKARLSLGPRPS